MNNTAIGSTTLNSTTMSRSKLSLVTIPTGVLVADGVVDRSWRLEHFYGAKPHDPHLVPDQT